MLITYILTTMSVILFCACCYAFIKSVTVRIPLFNNTGYSKAALRVARAYKAFAWACMTVFFLVTLVSSFYAVFVEL